MDYQNLKALKTKIKTFLIPSSFFLDFLGIRDESLGQSFNLFYAWIPKYKSFYRLRDHVIWINVAYSFPYYIVIRELCKLLIPKCQPALLFHPACLLIWGKIPTCTFIPSCTIIREVKVTHEFITVCWANFERNFKTK